MPSRVLEEVLESTRRDSAGSVRSSKLTPSRLRPWNVPRDPLLRRLRSLDAGLSCCVIEAPAGYGKSTLMRQWLDEVESAGGHSAWIALDANDNEPARFAWLLQGAIGALIRLGRLAGPAPQGHDLDDVVDLLVTGGLEEAHVTLFIDDFHFIDHPAIVEAMARLMLHCPAEMRLVFASREAIPMPCAKSRMEGRMIVVGAADLALSRDEAKAFLGGVWGGQVGDAALTTLHQRTGGWAAMLQLAGLAMASSGCTDEFVRDFAGTDTEISRYLCEVALDLQQPPIRQLLLRTAPLDFFSPELCETALGIEHAGALIEEVEFRRLLVGSVDRHRRWFRYHSLFKEFLEARLQIEAPGARDTILRQAAQWFYSHGQTEAAVDHAVRGGDYSLAAQYASHCVADLALRRGGHTTIQRWMRDLPDAVLEQYPVLKIGVAWVFAFRHRRQEAENLLQSLERDCEANPTRSVFVALGGQQIGAMLDMIRAVAMAADDRHEAAWACYRQWEKKWNDTDILRASILTAWGYSALALQRIREAKRLTDAADSVAARCDARYALGWNNIVKVRIALFEGRMGDAAALTGNALDGVGGSDPIDGLVGELLQICLAEARYALGDLTGASDALRLTGESVRDHVSVELGEAATRVRARLALSEGDSEKAIDTLRQGILTAVEVGLPRLADLLGGELATTLLRLGRDKEAGALAEEMGLSHPSKSAYAATMELRQIVQARLLLGHFEFAHAAALASKLRSHATAIGHHGLELSALCVLAAAQWNLGQRHDARRLVTSARLIAAAAGTNRLLADDAYLIDKIDDAGSRETREDLEARAGDRWNGPTGILSRRERHILSLVSQGLTNRATAETLYVTEETVKWHLRNITRKLGAHNRMHAVQLARQSGLLIEAAPSGRHQVAT